MDSDARLGHRMKMAFLAQAVFFASLATIIYAQPSPPAQGIQIGTPSEGWDIRFPLTVTQCEPVFIYYNNTASATLGGVGLTAPDGTYLVYFGPLPLGVAYLEWVCNIPTGFAFVAFSDIFYPLVVQPGPLSSCLSDLTTTYQYAAYDTASFRSYTSTRHIVITSTFPRTSLATSTVSFPTGSFSTITVNPELIVTSPTSIPSPTISSPTHPSPSGSSSPPPARKSRTAAIVGGVIGGVALFILFSFVFVRLLRKRSSRRRSRLDLVIGDEPIVTSPMVRVQSGNTPGPSTPGTNVPNESRFNWSSSAAGHVASGGPMLNSSSITPKSDPHLTTLSYEPRTPQSHEPTFPQPDLSSASAPSGRGGVSFNPASIGPPTPQTQPEPAPESDILTTLNAFSRLSPEQRRALFPVLGTMTAVPQPSGPVTSVPGAPPSYSPHDNMS